MELNIFVVICVFIAGAECYWHIELNNPNPAFDPKFYKDVLDPEKCQQQLNYIKNNTFLALQFFDASANLLPRGLLGGNTMDFGNFHQCMSLHYEAGDVTIKGKYCSILVKAGSIISLSSNNPKDVGFELKQSRNHLKQAQKIDKTIKDIVLTMEGKPLREIYNEKLLSDLSGLDITIRLGMCIPKPCTTRQMLDSLIYDFSSDMVFTEDFCRLPNDKLWSPADTTAVVIFLIIGILTLVYTSYDVICKFILKRDAKDTNSYLQIFSAYTNGRRVVNFNSSLDALQCLDGIRVLATLWVVLGHATYSQTKYLNLMDVMVWIRGLESIYIIAAPLTVDTFFTMTGILLVYTTCGKMNGTQLIRNLPLFYLNRLLRMFPLLATAMLLQASFFHRLSDGPMWRNVPHQVDNCRTHWWITLLHLQNFINSDRICLGHSWYIAIDVQLYIISPLVLFWVLGSSRSTAWIALAASLLVTLTGATVYNFHNNFLVNNIPPPDRVDEISFYMKYYYTNILTRASPFFVGMLFGYLLHIYRGKRIHLAWSSVILFWSSAVFILTTLVFSTHFVIQEGWNQQFVDNMLNSFMRPAWGMSIGWIVFACVQGYGGPVNWFLSLDMWRLPARLCYGVYLFHYPIMYVVADSVINPVYFSPPRFMFMFMAYVSISFFVAYFAALLIDAPFSTIFKRLFEKQKKDSVELPKQIEQVTIAKIVNFKNRLSNGSIFDHKRFDPIFIENNVEKVASKAYNLYSVDGNDYLQTKCSDNSNVSENFNGTNRSVSDTARMFSDLKSLENNTRVGNRIYSDPISSEVNDVLNDLDNDTTSREVNNVTNNLENDTTSREANSVINDLDSDNYTTCREVNDVMNDLDNAIIASGSSLDSNMHVARSNSSIYVKQNDVNVFDKAFSSYFNDKIQNNLKIKD